MPPKPIDKRNQLEGREALWAAIRRLKSFTLSELRGETRCSKETTKDYVTGLVAAKYLKIEPQTPPIFHLINDTGVETPRVRKDGSFITQGQGRENMWRTMRILKDSFTFHDLAIQASTDDHPVAENEAKDYIIHLQKAGYLTRSGTKLAPRYRLLSSKYTGPKPPMIQRIKQVYDQNLKKVMWQGGSHDKN